MSDNAWNDYARERIEAEADAPEGRWIAGEYVDLDDIPDLADIDHGPARLWNDDLDLGPEWAEATRLAKLQSAPPPPRCPECAQGKHQNCTEQLLTSTDDWVWCSCMTSDHQPAARAGVRSTTTGRDRR